MLPYNYHHKNSLFLNQIVLPEIRIVSEVSTRKRFRVDINNILYGNCVLQFQFSTKESQFPINPLVVPMLRMHVVITLP